jgi:DNA-binding transcriptional regulator GbsR (MarR family)
MTTGNIVTTVQRQFMEAMGRVAEFWGAPASVGSLYGAIYCAPKPVSLDELVEQVGVTKGAISLNVRALERLGLVRWVSRVGDRKDYYEAEPDFWNVVRGILRERRNRDFERALSAVRACAEILGKAGKDDREVSFLKDRVDNVVRFFGALDRVVATILALDDLGSGTLGGLFGKRRRT